MEHSHVFIVYDCIFVATVELNRSAGPKMLTIKPFLGKLGDPCSSAISHLVEEI